MTGKQINSETYVSVVVDGRPTDKIMVVIPMSSHLVAVAQPLLSTMHNGSAVCVDHFPTFFFFFFFFSPFLNCISAFPAEWGCTVCVSILSYGKVFCLSCGIGSTCDRPLSLAFL